MADPAILFLKPGAISAADKKLLRKAGVLVIETERPSEVKFIRANAELSSTEMLRCAAAAIDRSGTVQQYFGQEIARTIKTKAVSAPLEETEAKDA